MSLVDIDRQAVLSAIQEFAALGRERFLEQSGLGQLQTSGATFSYVRLAQKSGLYSAWLSRSVPSQNPTLIYLTR